MVFQLLDGNPLPTIQPCILESFDGRTGIILLHIDICNEVGCQVMRAEADCGESTVLLACAVRQ
jgi:hypothetical protein